MALNASHKNHGSFEPIDVAVARRLRALLQTDPDPPPGPLYYLIQNVEWPTPARAVLACDEDGAYTTAFPDDRLVKRDERLLERARRRRYGDSSLRDLPAALRERFFRVEDEGFVLDPAPGRRVDFVKQDLRVELPEDSFHLVLCRNLVFTYYEERLQRELLARLMPRLEPGGLLVIGIHESLPGCPAGLIATDTRHGLFLRREP